MVKIAKKTKRYPINLTDAEWSAVEPFLPKAGSRGQSAAAGSAGGVERHPLSGPLGLRVADAADPLSPCQTVYWWFRRLARRLMFRTIHEIALMIDQARSEREPETSAAALDSQSVKAPAAQGTRGYDGAKTIVGRKRHIAVDTDGRLLMVNLNTAGIADSTGAQAVLDALAKRWPRIKHLFADSA